MHQPYNLAFVGGGLAASLAAYRLKQKQPRLSTVIIEKNQVLGGEHTWSFHANDLTPVQHEWINPFVSKSWPCYEVIFPSFHRTIRSSYFSVRSESFYRIMNQEPELQFIRGQFAKTITPNRVTLENGTTIEAQVVIDARGWQNSHSVPLAYQKFVGQDLVLKRPHGLTSPIVMDATQDQKDGYRFFYLLPWSDTSLLIEDTRYSDSADINPDDFRREISAYVERKEWKIKSVQREEIGALAIPLEGMLPPWPENIPCLGTRAGLFHATTGYSFPQAVKLADALAETETFCSESMFKWARLIADHHWKGQQFFRLLNRLLFRAAVPSERYKVLEKFYRLPDISIRRFYAGELSKFDQLRILSGKPPVSVLRAISCIFEKGKRMS